MTNDLERAVDTVLSGLATTPEQRERILRMAMNPSSGAEPPPRKFFEHLPSFRIPRLAVVFLAAALLMLLPLLQSAQKDPFVRYSSEDGQDYIIEGIGASTPVPGGIADAQPYNPGYYTGSSYEEAERVYGEKLPRLTWLPEGAELTLLYVAVFTDTRDALISYEVPQGRIQLLVTEFPVGESGAMYIFQDGEGEYITLANGTEAYLTTNVERNVIVWQKGYSVYQLSTILPREELLRMVESIR